jgi:hypothetical protein
MKTPREFLLNRHAAVEPRLDMIAESVVASIAEERCVARLSWHERLRALFVMPRLGWSAFGAAWLIIVVLNVASHENTPATIVAQAPRPETIEILREQKQLYAELIDGGAMSPVEPVRPKSNKHSAREVDFAFA